MNLEKISVILDKVIEGASIALIFLVPLVFALIPFVYDRFGVPKIFVLFLLVKVIVLLFCAKTLFQNKFSIPVSAKLHIPLVLIFFSEFASLIFSGRPLFSFSGSYFRWQGFYTFIHIFIFLFVLIRLWQGKEFRRRLLLAIFFSATLSSFYGLVQAAGLDPVLWGPVTAAEQRAFSTIGQTNFFAVFLLMSLPLSIYATVYYLKDYSLKVMAVFFIAVQALAFYFTYSRAGLAALSAMILVFFLFLIVFYRYEHRRLVLWITIGSILAITVLSAAVFNNSPMLRQRLSDVSYKTGTGYVRMQMWSAAINGMKEFTAKQWLFGLGQENQEVLFIKSYTPEWGVYEDVDSHADRAHNNIIDLVLTHGLFGLLGWCALILFLLHAWLQKWKDFDQEDLWLTIVAWLSLVGYFIGNFFSFSDVTNRLYFYVILSLLILILSGRKQDKEFALPISNQSPRMIVFVAVSIFLATFFYRYEGRLVLADYHFMKSTLAKDIRNDCTKMMQELDATMYYDPGVPEYKKRYLAGLSGCLNSKQDGKQLLKSNSETVVGLLAEQESSYKTAAVQAVLYSRMGYYINPSYYGKASELFEQLISQNPYFTYIYLYYGQMKLWQRQYDEAVKILERGMENIIVNHDQNYFHRKRMQEEKLADFYFYIGEARYYQEKHDDAKKAYHDCLKLNPYFPPAYEKLILIATNQDDLASALRYYQDLRRLGFRSAKDELEIAKIYKEQGDNIRSIEHAAASLEIDPEFAAAKEFIKTLK